MQTKQEKAVSSHQSGFNCAQSVLTAFSDELKFDDKLALCISCGFGAGMGRLQKTCGAVTGSYMVLGIYACKKYTDNIERKEKSYALIQQFDEKFRSMYNTTDCKPLLGCNLMTEEGRQFARENNLFEIRCNKYIADSITIVEELTGK
ncbi:MAG TPA: C-GCAxxG-C-C family protein [Bacteroidales bacterium]|nr:C-GCAxxG-C-C family protein [Bacteroidales bacterium]